MPAGGGIGRAAALACAREGHHVIVTNILAAAGQAVADAIVEGDRLRGWGVIRPCRIGYKVAPLVADNAAIAGALFDDLVCAIPGEPVFVDVPEPNVAAVELASWRGLRPVFETARMYKGPPPDVALDATYGITSFELG